MINHLPTITAKKIIILLIPSLLTLIPIPTIIPTTTNTKATTIQSTKYSAFIITVIFPITPIAESSSIFIISFFPRN